MSINTILHALEVEHSMRAHNPQLTEVRIEFRYIIKYLEYRVPIQMSLENEPHMPR